MSARFSRRDVLKKGVATLSVTSVLASLSGATQALGSPSVMKSTKRPNILFIPIDDMNDWTGFLGGYPLTSTPNMDRLARMGAAMHRARTPVPVCQAARGAILFGAEPQDTGMYTNATNDWRLNPAFDDRTSLPGAFREQGYTTLGTGKIFHGGWRDNSRSNDPKAWSDYLMQPGLNEDGKEALVWGCRGTVEGTEDMTRARIVADIFSKPQKDLFMAFGVRKPHMKWVVPDVYCQKFPRGDIVYPLGAMDPQAIGYSNKDFADLGPAGRAMADQHRADHTRLAGSNQWRDFVRAYLACIAEADHAIGVAVDGVLKGPNADNTIICIWSDHGWQLGEKLTWRKFTLWERALRVPVIFAGRGISRQANRDCFSTIDLYKTLCGLAGIDAPSDCAGSSHAARLAGKTNRPARNSMVSTWALDIESGGEALNSEKGWRKDIHFSVADERYSLIQYGTGEQELYDHRVDPFEWANIVDRKSSRKIVSRLASRIPSRVAPPIVGGGEEVED